MKRRADLLSPKSGAKAAALFGNFAVPFVEIGDKMIIEHNSRMDFYRSPFGAVKCGESIHLRVALKDAGIPQVINAVFIFDETRREQHLKYVMNVGEYCVYETKTEVPRKTGLLWYYFEMILGGKKVYYGNNEEMLGGIGKIYEDSPKAYQVTVYSRDYHTPQWFAGSVMYQIFPDRFFNPEPDGSFLDERPDIIKRRWGDVPYYKAEQFGGKYLANDFFGGNLKGIAQKMSYIAELGVDVIYLNPIFKAYSNHRYDTGNYMQIDEILGTQKDFENLCKTAEEYGIRIILDGVFNHTGSNSLYFNKNGEYDSVGAYQSKESEFFDWYNFEEWPDKYESWWGIDTLPGVREDSQSYRDYILRNPDSVVKHWLKAGASGWRLDVVDELPDDFVKLLRKEVKKTKEDAVIIGEVWEDASNKESYGKRREYLLGDELDSVMNYPLRNALIDIALGRIDAEKFDERIMSIKENYPPCAYNSLMNFLSSHDVERILTVAGGAPDSGDKDFRAVFRLEGEDYAIAVEKVKQLVMFQMLMPGVPCIYYGDEIGMQGYADPFCRGTFDWEHQDGDLKLWYKMAAALRKSSKAYTSGEFETVYKYEQGYGFIRLFGDDKHVVIGNFAKEEKVFRVDLARFDIFYLSNEIYDEFYGSEDGIYYISMPPFSVNVFCGTVC